MIGSAGEGDAAVNGGGSEGGDAVNGEMGEGAGIVNGCEGGGRNPVNGHTRGEGGPLDDSAGLSGGDGNSVNGSAGGGGTVVTGGEGESAAVSGSAGGGSSGGGGSIDRRWWAAAGVAAVGVVAAVGIGIGSGDPPEPDARLADAQMDAGFVEPRLDAALADGHLDALVDAALADAALPPVDFPTGGPFASATPARPALRRVPAGRLRFDDGFGAVRTLTVARAVAMSDTPVSRAQYEVVMGVAPPVPTSDGIDPRPVRVTPQDPATGITVAQARAYCDALSRSEGRTPHYANPGKTANGYRLPDEAAWVMACTAGRSPTAALAEHPWGVAPGERVREWVDDRFSRPGSAGPVVAPGAGQAVRGGGRRQAAELRCLDRIEIAGGKSGPVVGFRVVRPLAATER